MMGWKYIMLELTLPSGDTKVEFPVIFPDKMVHIEIATVVKLCAPLDGNEVRVSSAGAIEQLTVRHVGGGSTTLGIRSKTEDKHTINTYNYSHGIKS